MSPHRKVVTSLLLLALQAVVNGAVNYNLFNMNPSSSSFRMDPAFAWEEGSVISCMDVSEEGEVLIGGLNAAYSQSQPLNLMYFDASSGSLGSPKWTLPFKHNENDKQFENCKFTPQPDPELGHRYVIASHLLLTSNTYAKRTFLLIDPQASGSYSIKGNYLSRWYTIENEVSKMGKSEKYNTEFAIIQEGSIIVVYTVYMFSSSSRIDINKYIIKTTDPSSVANPETAYSFSNSGSPSSLRMPALHQIGNQLYFSFSHTLSTSQTRMVIGRFVECSGCAQNYNLDNVGKSYTATTGGTTIFVNLLPYPEGNKQVMKSIEVISGTERMVAVGNIRQFASGDVSSVQFGFISFHTWCASSIQQLDFKLPVNEQVNPMALHAKTISDNYLLIVTPSDPKKLQVVKIVYPQDTTCSYSSVNPSAWLVSLSLSQFSSADIAQVVLARFDSQYDSLFIGGKAKGSGTETKGFIDGVSLGYISGLTKISLSWSGYSEVTSSSYLAVSDQGSATITSTAIVSEPCLSLASGSWATTGYVLTIENSPVKKTFFADELFSTKDASSCPIQTCTVWTFETGPNLYDRSQYSNEYCTVAHADNITIATDPATSKLRAEIDISEETFDYKVCLKCGNSDISLMSNVISINVTDPCRWIPIAATEGSLPKALGATQKIFITQNEVRVEPDDGQTEMTQAIDMFPNPSADCPIVSITISKVVKVGDLAEVEEAVWSTILSLENADGLTLKVQPPAATVVLPFKEVQVFVLVSLEKQSKEFMLATVNIKEDIERNKAPFLEKEIEPVELSFEYYPVGADPDAQQQPAEDETLEITPPEKKSYVPVVVALPSAGDNNTFDYVASIVAGVPIHVKSVVTFDAKTNQTEFTINAFSFTQAKMKGFEVVYTLTDRWGLTATYTQSVKLSIDLVYETRTFTKIEKKEEPEEEVASEEEAEEEESVKEEEEPEKEEEAPPSATGYVFPGVVIPEEEVLLWAGEDNSPPTAAAEKKYVPLRASISDITTLGLFTLQFNQAIQGELFTLEDLGNVLFFEIVPGDYEKSPYFDITNLGFVWEAVKFDEGKHQLLFQVNFTNAMYISAESVPDEMVIRVSNPDAFKSVEFDRRISYGSKNMWSPVKKQMPNNEASQSYDKGTTTTQESMSAGTIFTFCLNMVFRGALREIMGTILSLQIIINLFLLTIPFPANSSNLVSKLKPIVSFNILKSFTTLTTDFFPLDVDKQAEYRGEILASAQSMGTKSHNSIPNLGNMFHLLAYYLWMVIFLAYYKFRGLSSLKWGLKHTQVKKQLCCGQLLTILISGFLPITIAVFYQFKHPLFTTIGEKIGFYFGLFFLLLEHVFFPIALIWILTVPKQVLDQPAFKEKWGLLYTKARYDTLPRRAYLQVFILRRLLLLYIGLEIYGQPPLQLVAINIMNICVIIYTGLAEPQRSLHDRRMELFNEFMVALITYNLFMFTDALPDKGAQYFIGWVFAGSLVIMLIGNSYFTVKNTVKRVYLLLLKKFKEVDFRAKQAKQNYGEQLKELREIQAQTPLSAKETEIKLQAEEALNYPEPRRSRKAETRLSHRYLHQLSVISEEDATDVDDNELVLYRSIEKPTRHKRSSKKKEKTPRYKHKSEDLLTRLDPQDSLPLPSAKTPSMVHPPSSRTSRKSHSVQKRQSLFSLSNLRKEQTRKSSDFDSYLSERMNRRHLLRLLNS